MKRRSPVSFFRARIFSGQQWAQVRVAAAKRKGLLPNASTKPCADCGGPAIEYDHRDYNKPIDVSPVCRSCNLRRGPAKWKNWGKEEFLAYMRSGTYGGYFISRFEVRKRCEYVEQASGGLVTRQELRPDLYEPMAA